MKKILKNLLPDIIIVLSLMIITFFVIDIFNEAMAFLNNTATKIIAFLLALLSFAFAVISIFKNKN